MYTVHIDRGEDDREPREWRTRSFALDGDRRALDRKDEGEEQDNDGKQPSRKGPPRAYRQNRLVQATLQEDAARQPLYHIPQRPFFSYHRKEHPQEYGTDTAGRFYRWATPKLPYTGEEDEAAAFFARKDYSPAQRTLYVILPPHHPKDRYMSMDFPERDSLMIRWPSDGADGAWRTYHIHHADFEAKRGVGVAVVTECRMMVSTQPSGARKVSVAPQK